MDKIDINVTELRAVRRQLEGELTAYIKRQLEDFRNITGVAVYSIAVDIWRIQSSCIDAEDQPILYCVKCNLDI